MITLLVVGLAILVNRWPRGWEYSFSQHAAQTKSATVYYAILCVLVLVPLNIFLFAWFIPAFHMSLVFGYLFLLASILQIACTILPEKGETIKIHRWLAGASAMLLPPCLGFLYAGDIGVHARITIIIAAILMVAIMLWVALDTQRRVPYALQIVYYAGFFVPLCFISFGKL